MESARTRSRIVLWLPVVVWVCVACGSDITRRPVERAAAPAPVPVARPAAPAPNVPHPVDPSKFQSGACVALPPTGAPRHLTVFLDAGHGGRDPGAVGSTASGRTIYEAVETLAVELDTAAILRRAGYQVVVSRTRDTSVLRLGPDDVSGRLLTVDGSHEDILARDVCANEADANVLVGIFFDAGPHSNAGSITGYDAVRPFARENLRLARFVQADVLAAMNAQGWDIPNDGVKSDAGLGSVLSAQGLAYGHLVLIGPASGAYVPTPSRMPGAVIEPLYITDPYEGSIAVSRRGQTVIAEGLAKAIGEYFG